MDTLEARLRLLASGNWRGKGLSIVLGTAAQKKHLYSPLLKATAGRGLRIIWQVDFGLCEDRVYRQHIKGSLHIPFRGNGGGLLCALVK